jgi:hypothetical protein
MSKKETKCEIEKMREMELKLLIIEFNKASQLDRSFSKTQLSTKNKKKFRDELLEHCMCLMKNIDDGTLGNQVIRGTIEKLTKIDPKNISFGQAQKVINVVLKQYCFIMKKNNLLKELDCPLDSTTMNVGSAAKREYGIEHESLKRVNIKDYEGYQDIFEKEHGMRILRDREYDKERIQNFLNFE